MSAPDLDPLGANPLAADIAMMRVAIEAAAAADPRDVPVGAVVFDADGREVAPRTVQACVANGWAEPWLKNPLKPDWLVCRLTPKGYAVLGRTTPRQDAGEGE